MNFSKLNPVFRRFCTSGMLPKVNPNSTKSPLVSTYNYPGQPSPFSHPHKLKSDEVTHGLTKDEYADRRRRFMKIISTENHSNLVIFPAASTAFSAPDVPYPFRQESNFSYLCGYQEPDSFLVIQNENEKCISTLFVRPKNAEKELWEGPRAGVDGAVALTGVDAAYDIDQLKSFLYETIKKSNNRIWYSPNVIPQKLSDLARDSQLEELRRMTVVGYENGRTLSPYRHVHELRWRKSPAEVRLMRRAGQIASSAFVETMKFSKPGVDENFLLAKMDYECRTRGAQSLAYPPVIAGGDRANIIHYLNADQIVNENELILMDAGCEYGGYVSDITRCWPVSGRFTPAQREIYECLVEVQSGCLKFVESTRPVTLRDVYMFMLNLLADCLQRVGVLPDTLSGDELLARADDFCPHHVSHYLGMDVHDTESVSKTKPLEPGVVITIEPGIYLKSDDYSIPEKFRGIGLRIEDDVLITESGIEVFSASSPKKIDEIERICGKKL